MEHSALPKLRQGIVISEPDITSVNASDEVRQGHLLGAVLKRFWNGPLA